MPQEDNSVDILPSLSPDLVFGSAEKWNDEEYRDDFLEQFLGHLQKIESFDMLFAWSDELEEFLWTDPNPPPWRMKKGWSNQLVPIIYKIFQKCMFLVDNSDGLDACKITPDIFSGFERKEILKSWHVLLHILIDLGETPYIASGVEFRDTDTKIVKLLCDCDHISIDSEVIRHPAEWVHLVDYIDFWPQDTGRKEVKRLRLAVEIASEQKFADLERRQKQDFEFDDNFVEDLVNANPRFRELIIKGIAKRVNLSMADASADRGLNDEPVRGREGERRMRISGEQRIHYRFTKNTLVFIDYYGPGEHDKGLR